MKAAIITVNTKAYKEKKEGVAAAALKRILEQVGFEIDFMEVLPEDKRVLTAVMKRLAEGNEMDLILTTGSTGVRRQDCIPEATREVVDRLIPGIPEAIRTYNIRYTKRAMLDRSVAGMCSDTMILNLPDTAKSAKESLEYVLPELVHIIESVK